MQGLRRSTLIFCFLFALTAAIWLCSMRYPPVGEYQVAPTAVRLAPGGVVIERDLNLPLPVRPRFTGSVRSILGFSSREYERLFHAPDRAPGAIPLPAEHSLGPDYNRWYFVHVYRSWCIPLWPLMLAFGAVLMVRVVKHVQGRQRQRHGLCERCGYDLRGSSGQCPECGMRTASN
jgi:hypothetical protein